MRHIRWERIFSGAAKPDGSAGMNGPFCIEGVYDDEARLHHLSSQRDCCRNHIYMDGSPYYTLLFDEPMSMGRRIAREINNAAKSGQLKEITT